MFKISRGIDHPRESHFRVVDLHAALGELLQKAAEVIEPDGFPKRFADPRLAEAPPARWTLFFIKAKSGIMSEAQSSHPTRKRSRTPASSDDSFLGS
jgi:hypothetical protein